MHITHLNLTEIFPIRQKAAGLPQLVFLRTRDKQQTLMSRFLSHRDKTHPRLHKLHDCFYEPSLTGNTARPRVCHGSLINVLCLVASKKLYWLVKQTHKALIK